MHGEKKAIFRAGTIPYKLENGDIKMLFMRPSESTFGGDSFQLAKGKIEDGEDAQTAAIREAKEEVGLLHSSIDGDVDLLGVFLGRTTVFVCKVRPNAILGVPGVETSETAWLSLDEFNSVGRVLHRQIVRSAYDLICQRESLQVT